MVNATAFLSCASRVSAYGGAFVASSIVVRAIPPWPDKNALEYASFHMFSNTKLHLKALDDSFWVNHVSGYEHAMKRFDEETVADRVQTMVGQELKVQCAGHNESTTAALAVVPFYGGQPSNASVVNTGSSHSRASRSLKLHTLLATVCSMLHVARQALVGVCTTRDHRDATSLLQRHLPPGRVGVHLLDCAREPAFLPYRLLNRIRRSLREEPNLNDPLDQWLLTPFDFLMYNEADQIFSWTSRSAVASLFQVLRDHTEAYAIPQRYEKRWGSPPGSTSRYYMSRGMNKCKLAEGDPTYTPQGAASGDDIDLEKVPNSMPISVLDILHN